jgi:hypothetical protein
MDKRKVRNLGHISSGTRRIADRAVTAVLDYGRVALFLSLSTGKAVAVAYTSPDIEVAFQRYGACLVGTYQDDLDANAGLFDQLLGDLAEHVRGPRKMAA